MPIKIVQIGDLDASQKGVVMSQPYDSPMFVSGPPGSGKTSVAILRAKVLLDNGYSNTLFLLYNHSLYGYLTKMFKKMNLANSVNIQTKDKFFRDLGFHNGIVAPNNYYNYEAKYKYITDNLLRLAKKGELSQRFDLVFMDESQDFLPNEIEIIKLISNKIVAMADVDQTLYQSDDSVTPFFNSFANKKKLSTIYRFGKDIAQLAESFCVSGKNLSNMVTKVGNTPAYKINVSSNAEAIDKIVQIVDNKSYADGTMAILSPKVDSLEQLASALKTRGVENFFSRSNADLRNYDFDSKKPLLLTAHSSKGLEFDTVIMYNYTNSNLTWMDEINQIIYLSLTRTCGELYVIVDQNTYRPIKDLPGLKDINDAKDDDIDGF